MEDGVFYRPSAGGGVSPAGGGERLTVPGASECPLWVPIGGAAVVGLATACQCGLGSDDCLSLSRVVPACCFPLLCLISAAMCLVPSVAGLLGDAFTTAPSRPLLWS